MAAHDYTLDMAALRSWQLFKSEDNHIQQERLRKYLPMALEELTEHQKEVFELYYKQGLNVTQTAQVLGCNKSSVSRTLQRIHHRIHNALRYAL